MSYSVVLLDGKELHNLTAEQIRELFLSRKLNQDSLFCSTEFPRWQMLKRGFDLSRWVPVNPTQPPVPQAVQPVLNNPFHQPAPVPGPVSTPVQPPIDNGNSTVTFNQFPPVSPAIVPSQPQNGYSQNNQSETYYQAESNQTSYNFGNDKAAFQPSRYNFPTNQAPAAPTVVQKQKRPGARQAAVFIAINALINLILMAAANLASADGASSSGPGPSFRGMTIPLIVDAILALNLWTQDDVETARKWVLARAYLGLIVFGFVLPGFGLQTGDILISIFSFITSILYVLSLGITLHGKEFPSSGRLMIGAGTFAIYFLVMFGAIGLSAVIQLAPDTAFLKPTNRDFEKYKIEGREFQDKTTGAKVSIPEGWSMISLSNPVVHTPEARMIAVDQDGQSLTMLEVVPVPGNLDMKRQNPSSILDALADNVVEAMNEDSRDFSTGSKANFSEITRIGIAVGKHPAKLLVFEKTIDGEKMKGHMIITYDELTFYVMHSWCPASVYDVKQAEFKHFEENFVVPEKINSTFTQTAESEKQKAREKKF